MLIRKMRNGVNGPYYRASGALARFVGGVKRRTHGGDGESLY